MCVLLWEGGNGRMGTLDGGGEQSLSQAAKT